MLAKQALLVCLELVIVFGVIGCAPTMVSTDAAVYQWGKLYAVSSRDMDAVYQASLQAMEKLELRVTDKAKDVFGAKVMAKSADGKMVTVRIKPTVEQKTEYCIQVSSFGNEERSRKIFSEIEGVLTKTK
jgi:hypothetical protein